MPLIGAISDANGLRAGLQVTWVAILVSGCCWAWGALYLPPLLVAKSKDDHEEESRGGHEEKYEGVTFLSLLCGSSQTVERRTRNYEQANPLVPDSGDTDDQEAVVSHQDCSGSNPPGNKKPVIDGNFAVPSGNSNIIEGIELA
uniref:Uncharacterized protein n=2 Tax=Octactis speculum TaxID=3111310 RepID=A0A7S2AJ70_9STRA